MIYLKRQKYILIITGMFFRCCLFAQGITIPAGAYMVADNGNISVTRNFTNNGRFTHNGGTVVFAGSTQTLKGSSATVFKNITVRSGSTTTITTAGHSLTNKLLSNGALHANGNLTLRSDATQTAAIDGAGSGEVLGTVIIQRYIASGFGYKYFSSPFQNDTVGDFSNDMNLNGSFPTFYRYDENQPSNGWISYAAGAGILNPMHGYAANLGSSHAAKTVDLKGVVNNHTVSRTLYNHGFTYTQGFNLVGNPYPSPVNWDAAGGWTKTNIDNAVYYFTAGSTDQYAGAYSSYVNGVSSDGTAGNTIAAMQGFFVHVTDGSYPVSAILAVHNTARIINPMAVFFKKNGDSEKALLRFTAGYQNEQLSDALTVYLDNAATGKDFNRNLDALKLLNNDPRIPNVYIKSADDRNLSIQAMSFKKDTLTRIPVELITKKDGFIVFTAKSLDAIPDKFQVYLYDAVTMEHHDLRKNNQYTKMLISGNYSDRFFLEFRLKDQDKIEIPEPTIPNELFKIYANGNKLYVNRNVSSDTKISISVVNMLGQVVWKKGLNGNITEAIPLNVASGVYIVHVFSGTNKTSQKIFIGR